MPSITLIKTNIQQPKRKLFEREYFSRLNGSGEGGADSIILETQGRESRNKMRLWEGRGKSLSRTAVRKTKPTYRLKGL